MSQSVMRVRVFLYMYVCVNVCVCECVCVCVCVCVHANTIQSLTWMDPHSAVALRQRVPAHTALHMSSAWPGCAVPL